MIQSSKLKFFKNYSKFTSNSSIFFYLIILLEIIPVFLGILESANFTNVTQKVFLEYIFYINYLSPYYYIKSSIHCTSSIGCSVSSIFYIVAIVLSYALFLILFLLLCSHDSKRSKKEGSTPFISKIIFIVINSFKIIMNLFNMSVIFIYTNLVITTFPQNSSSTSLTTYFLILIYLLILLFFLILNYFYLKINNTIMSFDKSKISFKDTIFSPNYNNFIFILKILISLRDNLDLVNAKNFKIALSIIILFIALVYSSDIIYKLSQNKILFITNFGFNTLRSGLIVFIFLEVIYKLLLNSPMCLNYVTIPNFLISIVFIFYMLNNCQNHIINNSDKLNQIILLINEIIFNKENAGKLMRKIRWRNDINLVKKSLKFNPELDEFTNCFSLLDELRSDMSELNQDQRRIINFVSLVLYRLDPKAKNKFIFSVKKELNKKYNLINDFEFSCISIYENSDFGEDFFKFTKINKIIEKYNQSNIIVQNSISNFSQIIETTHITYNEKFYNLVGALSQAKLDLKKNINYIFDKRNLYFANFNFFTLTWSYEFLFKEKIYEIENVFSEEEVRDVMVHHFKLDNILCLAYSLKLNTINVLNYSKDFSFNRGKDFELMFPDQIRAGLKNKFISALEAEFSNDCELFYFNPVTKTIKKFNFKFVTYQSIKSEVIFVLGTYTISDHQILLTRTQEKREKIEHNSLKWMNMVGFDEKIGDKIRRKKFSIGLLEMFYTRQEAEFGKKAKIYYKVNENFVAASKWGKFVVNSDFPEIYLTKLFESINGDFTDKIYEVHSTNNLKKKRTDQEEYGTELTNKDIIPLEEKGTSSSTGSAAHDGNARRGNEHNKSKTSAVAKLAFSTLIYNLILILYCIVFLVIGYSNTNTLKQFYTFRSSFQSFRYFFYHTYMTLYQNILLYKEGTVDISNYSYPNFFDKFNNNPKIMMDTAGYCVKELAFKLDMLKGQLSAFQSSLNSFPLLKTNGVVDQFQNNIDFYSIRQSTVDLSLQNTQLKFFDAISTLLNLGYSSFAPGTYFTSLWIMSEFDGKYDFSNVWDTNLNQAQIAVYEIVFNWETILRYFEALSSNIDNLYSGYLDVVLNTNVYFSIVLVILHFFYFLLTAFILKRYNYYMTKYNLIIKKISNEENISILNKKLIQLNNMNQLYMFNPIKCSSEIAKLLHGEIDEKVIALKKQFQSDSDKLMNEIDQKGGENEESQPSNFYVSRNEDVSPKTDTILNFFKVLILIFFVYFVFFVVSFYFLIYIFNQFTVVNSFATDYINTQIKLINNVLLLQTIIQNNQTDYDLDQFMTNGQNSQLGYLRSGYIETYETLKRLQISESSSILQQAVAYESFAMNCTNDYSLSDSIYSQFNSTVVTSSLIEVCNSYNFMNQGNLYNIQYELLYLQGQLLNAYEETGQDYTKMKAIWDRFSYFDQFVVFLLIVRPITDYFYNTLIYSIIISCINNFVIYSVIYLICNMLADIIILFLINKFIVRNIIKSDRDIKEFILWI